MGLVDHISQWLAPWQSLYDNSKLVSGSVTAVHLLALLYSGGLAIAADRSTLRAAGRSASVREYLIDELGAIHRPVLVALMVVFLSGLLLTAADFKTFVASPAFWVKMGLIVLLVVNGAVLTRTEAAIRRTPSPATDEPLWTRLVTNSRVSIVLWTLTLVAGVVVTDAT
jgi:hypothetical protein